MRLELAWADTRHHRVDLLVEREGQWRVITGTPSARPQYPPVPPSWQVALTISVPPDSGQHMVVIEAGRIEVRRLNGMAAWPSAKASLPLH